MEFRGNILKDNEIIGISVLTMYSSQQDGMLKNNYGFVIYTNQNQIEFRSPYFIFDNFFSPRNAEEVKSSQDIAQFLYQYAEVYEKVWAITKNPTDDSIPKYPQQIRVSADRVKKFIDERYFKNTKNREN